MEECHELPGANERVSGMAKHPMRPAVANESSGSAERKRQSQLSEHKTLLRRTGGKRDYCMVPLVGREYCVHNASSGQE